MKKRFAVGALILAVVLGIGYFSQRQLSRGVNVTPKMAQGHAVGRLQQTSPPVERKEISEQNAGRTSKLATPPRDGRLSVWFADATMNQEFIDRYGLSAEQIHQLHELRAELELRMKEIDAANAVVDVSEDQQTVTVTIKANAAAAKKQSDFYQRELERILGPVNLADLNRYLYVDHTEPVWNAGLLDKEIVIRKQTPTMPGDAPTYSIRAGRKYKSSPEGWPPAYVSATISTTGSREVLDRAYPAASLFMPKDM